MSTSQSSGSAPRTSELSEFSFYSVVDSQAGLAQNKSPKPVPRWRLAREGPFLSEIPTSSVTRFGQGCAFRSTTYRSSDHAQPSGKYGLPLHHPLVYGMDQRSGVGSFTGY